MKVFIYSSVDECGIPFDPFAVKGWCWLDRHEAYQYMESICKAYPNCHHAIEGIEIDKVWRVTCLDDEGDRVFATRKCWYRRESAVGYAKTVAVGRLPELLKEMN